MGFNVQLRPMNSGVTKVQFPGGTMGAPLFLGGHVKYMSNGDPFSQNSEWGHVPSPRPYSYATAYEMLNRTALYYKTNNI